MKKPVFDTIEEATMFFRETVDTHHLPMLVEYERRCKKLGYIKKESDDRELHKIIKELSDIVLVQQDALRKVIHKLEEISDEK